MKQTIGCQATISFPELGLRGIEAKIDTGAYYSALHCSSVRVFRKGGQRMLRFTVLDAKHPAYSDITFESTHFMQRTITSSNGVEQKRYVLPLQIKLKGEVITGLFSLADRSKMRIPVLLGRQTIEGHFVVDVAQDKPAKSPEFQEAVAYLLGKQSVDIKTVVR